MKPSRIRGFVRSRTSTALLAGIVVFVVGLMVWPGCAVVPLPSKRTPVTARTTAQFKFKNPKHPSHDEVIAQLGNPDEYVADVRVACYRVNDVIRRKVLLCLFIFPMDVTSTSAYDVAFVEFDEQDRVRRAEIKTENSYVNLKDAAHKWVNKKDSAR